MMFYIDGMFHDIEVHSKQFDFEFDLKGESSWLYGDAYLNSLLKNHVPVLQEILKHTTDPEKVVTEIQ